MNKPLFVVFTQDEFWCHQLEGFETDEDVARYVADNDVIVNPLQYEGYPSIGCWPCTEPVLDGEDQRAGRWRGTGKTECGLHFS